MRGFEKFKFTPKYQEKGKGPVVFELIPLDQRTLYALQADMLDRSPGPDGAIAVFEYAVKGWEGLDVPFSHEAKNAVVTGPGEPRWTMWLAQIAGELYRRSFLTETVRKNS
jgi:hypothetical protein